MGGSGKTQQRSHRQTWLSQISLVLHIPGSWVSSLRCLCCLHSAQGKESSTEIRGVQEFGQCPKPGHCCSPGSPWEQTAAPARAAPWFCISSGLLPLLWGQVGFGGPVPALRCHLSGEAKDCSWFLLQSSQTAPGTLMLPLSRQVSASGFFFS